MNRELYEYELEEHVDYWKASMRRDRDEFLFVVDVRMNEVTHQPNAALLLLEPSGAISGSMNWRGTGWKPYGVRPTSRTCKR
jgi:hypothetical protein